MSELSYLLEHHLIPESEMERVFRESYSADAEIGPDFMCFEEPYQATACVADKDSIILDLGCGYAAQCFYFTRCKQYIGIDLPMPKPLEKDLIHYPNIKPETRFQSDNAQFYIMSIQRFIAGVLPSLRLDKEHVIAVCSAVPDEKARELVSSTFPIHYISYPGLSSDITLPAPKQSLEAALGIREKKNKKILDITNAKFMECTKDNGQAHLYFELPITAYPSFANTYASVCSLRLTMDCSADTGNTVLKLSVIHKGTPVTMSPLTLQPGIDYTNEDIDCLQQVMERENNLEIEDYER